MHPAVMHSAERKHTPVKCCNNTLRLINQAQMHKKFPQGFWENKQCKLTAAFSQQNRSHKQPNNWLEDSSKCYTLI